MNLIEMITKSDEDRQSTGFIYHATNHWRLINCFLFSYFCLKFLRPLHLACMWQVHHLSIYTLVFKIVYVYVFKIFLKVFLVLKNIKLICFF
jgi:hypothetical protein